MTVYDASGWEALLENSGWLATLVVLAIAAGGLATWLGWRERRLAPRGWILLLLLRLVAIGAALLLLAGIERRTMTEIEEPSRVVLLADRSASMQLPSSNDSTASKSRQVIAAEALDGAAKQLAKTQDVQRADFDVALRYEAATEANEPGGSTRLGAALDRVLVDHTATPLAAILVASDGGWNAGMDPAQAAGIAATRGVPIHTLGVGPRQQPPSVAIRDLAAPSRASTGDRFRASVTINANAEAQANSSHRVQVALQEVNRDDQLGAIVYESEFEIDANEGLTAKSLDIEGPAAGEYELIATLTPGGDDADASDNRRTVRIELIDEPTRVLLAAGGPARDYRFLRDQLFRDELFDCDVLLQSAAGAVTQDAGEVLTALPSDKQSWEAYDALVAIDLDWTRVDESSQAALAEWVASRGGGVVLIGGPVYLPSVVRRGLAKPLHTLLPVALRDDPLALSAGIEASRDPRPVRLTAAGEAIDFLRPPTPDDASAARWEDFPGVYATLLPAEPKPGASVLARLGSSDIESPPFCVEHFYGAGRVVYLATAETWRLRKLDPAWFTSLHTGLLRHVSQGRLLGADAEGTLLTDRDRYDLGEAIAIRYVARSPETLDEDGPGFVRVISPDNASQEAPLEPVEGQAGVYVASIRGDTVGRYTAVYFSPAGQRMTTTAQVTLPSLESETVVQNVRLLEAIAATSGGQYIDLADPEADELIRQLAAATPSLAETNIELGPPDEEFTESIAQTTLGVMAAALLLEWLLRRSWRLA